MLENVPAGVVSVRRDIAERVGCRCRIIEDRIVCVSPGLPQGIGLRQNVSSGVISK